MAVDTGPRTVSGGAQERGWTTPEEPAAQAGTTVIRLQVLTSDRLTFN